MATALVPSLQVWAATDGSGQEWDLGHETASFDEAARVFEQLSAEGVFAAVYELGRFNHGHKVKCGYVGFWWSANLNDYMQRIPAGRGFGWTEDYDTFVKYEYAPTEAAVSLPSTYVVQPQPAPKTDRSKTVASAAEGNYVQKPCQNCGLILPMNQLLTLTHDVEVGRSSGTRRVSSSTSSTFSTRGFSNSTRSSRSSTTGRHYYKNERLLLCEECHARQLQLDRGAKIGRFFRALLS